MQEKFTAMLLTRQYHVDGTLPENPKAVWVFGSNLAGRHGAGAAKIAAALFGAERGKGFGAMGQCFAIPTKDQKLSVIEIAEIHTSIEYFLRYAKEHADEEFFVTRVGCGLAGYHDAQIAPMFKQAPANCSFPDAWKPYLD